MESRVPQVIRTRVDSLQREMFAGRYSAPRSVKNPK
jgi:hypothetical protein